MFFMFIYSSSFQSLRLKQVSRRDVVIVVGYIAVIVVYVVVVVDIFVDIFDTFVSLGVSDASVVDFVMAWWRQAGTVGVGSGRVGRKSCQGGWMNKSMECFGKKS